MPDTLYTIADIIADAQDLADREISDLKQAAPLVARLPAEEASDGVVHKYTKEVGAPVVGFRSVNQGVDQSIDTDQEVTADLEILEFSWKVDKALADRRRGKKGGREAFIAKKGNRRRNAALFTYEKQLIRGQAGGNPDGFAGFEDQASLGSLAEEMVINAGGTSVGAASSVYAIRFGDDDVMGVYNGDQPVQLGDTVVAEARDASDRGYPVYYTPGCTWLGLQVGGKYSIARLANVTAEVDGDGKFTHGVTDDRVAELITPFKAGEGPDLLVMSPFARLTLQRSRTATNTTGTPAPMPTESHGVPLMTTDALDFTEPLVA